jgi:hypothetical protein
MWQQTHRSLMTDSMASSSSHARMHTRVVACNTAESSLHANEASMAESHALWSFNRRDRKALPKHTGVVAYNESRTQQNQDWTPE